MKTKNLPVNAGKCQCISFNRNGYITESDNVLFNTGAWAGRSLVERLPFIKGIYKRLLAMKPTDEPMFFPGIRIEMEGYSGICDFMFTRVEQAAGDSFVWIIYDHTLHYGSHGGGNDAPVRWFDTGPWHRAAGRFE